jgi:hypothetical protein
MLLLSSEKPWLPIQKQLLGAATNGVGLVRTRSLSGPEHAANHPTFAAETTRTKMKEIEHDVRRQIDGPDTHLQAVCHPPLLGVLTDKPG